MTIDSRIGQRPRLRSLAMLAILVLTGCNGDAARTRDAAAEPWVFTHHTDSSELFLSFRPLVAGERSTLAAHFTRLADYSPVSAGSVDVVLSGGGAPTERFRVSAPRRPGLFAPTVQPRASGPRDMVLLLDGPGLQATHALGTVIVHASIEAARAAPAPRPPEGEIGYPKELQWASDFAIETLRLQPVRDSIRALAMIRPAADRQFLLTAPAAGQIRAAGGLPTLGERVERGQLLATLLPRQGGGSDVAALQADLAEARSLATLAAAELARSERLLALQAVPERRLADARSAHDIAVARLRAAEQRIAQLSGDHGGIPLRAPLSGELAAVGVAAGAAVGEGELLFHIVDRSELWLEAQVAEADSARLQSPTGASFTLPGLEQPVEIRVGANGRLVGVGSVIDADTRSLPVVLALRDPDPRIALNQLVEARLFTGAEREALTVPASALIDDGGDAIVFVMRGGESFSRVPVTLGVRDGTRVEVRTGLAAGDRVVARGAADVRRAAASPDAMGHGHAH
jgi:membrane fusion protein, heavy metal efflux system